MAKKVLDDEIRSEHDATASAQASDVGISGPSALQGDGAADLEVLECRSSAEASGQRCDTSLSCEAEELLSLFSGRVFPESAAR